MEDLFLPRQPWWGLLEEGVRDLLTEAFDLLAKAEKDPTHFLDYSFIVFPAAKAYEGFLKSFFLEKGFISREDYFGKRFRVGKALNPQLEREYRLKEGVYDKIVNYCGGKELADLLWEAWKNGRNLIFHWFPDEKQFLTLTEAKERLFLIVKAIDAAYQKCLK